MKEYLKKLWTSFVNKFFKKDKKNNEEHEYIFEGLENTYLSILIGSDLAQFGEDISIMCKELRRELKNYNGFVLPLVKITDEEDLQENEFRICIRNQIKYTGFTVFNKEYAIPELRNCLAQVCEKYVEDIFSLQLVEGYINFVRNRKSWLLGCYVLDFFTITSIKQILVYLLKNGESIKDIDYIFEKMCEYASLTNDKCYFREPLPIAKNILEDLRQANKKTEITEEFVKNIQNFPTGKTVN